MRAQRWRLSHFVRLTSAPTPQSIYLNGLQYLRENAGEKFGLDQMICVLKVTLTLVNGPNTDYMREPQRGLTQGAAPIESNGGVAGSCS